MIVVSDASPLHYLVGIGHESVLPQLFRGVLVPSAVVKELTHEKTPVKVKSWAANLPEWVEVRQPSRAFSAPKLGPGESEAIGLAMEMKAEALLIDERRGRAIAQAQGVVVIGLLGVLTRAAEKGLLRLPAAIEQLQATDFRLDPKLAAAALAHLQSP